MAVPADPGPFNTTWISSIFFPTTFKAFKRAARDHNGGSVLVVVEHRNIQLLFQTGLYLKAFGGSDILQIHTAEAGGDGLYSLDDLFSVLGIQADGEGIYVSKFLKQDRLSLHHRA